MKRATTCFMLLAFTLLSFGTLQAQNQVTYGFVQDPVDQLKLTAVAYPNFTSNNVTISTALFTFYLPAGTITTPAIPVLPAFGSFTDITGAWRIEKITPALYASFGFNANDLQGNDIYQCILQNSPSPNTINGQPVSLFSFTLSGDCTGGTVQVHINDNSIQMALLNNVGININNQMSVSVNDAPSFDLYSGNNPLTDNYDCPLDDVPVAVDDVASTNEDVAVTVNVTGNDNFGTDGPSASAITITVAPTNGIAVVDNNGTPNNPTDDKIVYTPNANFNGTDVLTYQICDADNDCDLATVTITVNAINDPPVANDDAVTTPEDNAITFSITANDTDLDGFIDPTSVDLDPNTAGIQTTFVVAGGTFTHLGAGNVTFTPNANFTGTATADYRVCDTGTPLPSLCDIATITITVNAANDPPTVPNTTVSTPEDTPFNVCVPITDVDNTTFAVVNICAPDGGVVSGLTNPATTQYCLTYTPNLNFNGPDTLCIQVCDGSGGCDTSYVIITVTPVNDPPIANDDATTTTEDTPVTLTVTTNDTDVDGLIDPATVDLDPVAPGIQATFVVAGGTFTYLGAGNVTFTPNANFNGTATADYRVCDTGTPLPAMCDIATITIMVNAANDPPTVPNTTVSTPEDTPFNVCVPITDVDNTSFAVASICTPDGGVVSGLTNPAASQYCLTYTPNSNFTGPDTLCIQVCDGAGGCDTSYVIITVTPVNDPPTAPNTTVSTPEDTPINVCVPITDVDNSTFTVVNMCAPDGGVVSGLTNPATSQYCLTYTPNLNYTGPDTLCVQVCDGSGGCDTSYVIITVTPVNDPPVANDDAISTPEDTPVTLTVTTNDTDVDGLIDPTTVDLDPIAPGIQTSFVAAGGTFTYLGAGNVTFTPNANFNGTATADYRVCDTGTPLPAMCDIATITITVNAVNDTPVANDDATTTSEDTPVTLTVTTNDTDVDGLIDPATVDLDPVTPGIQTTFVVAGGTFTYLGAGNVTFTPNANFTGTASADYRVCDTGTPLPSLCDIATITITVNAANDPPTVPNTTVSTPEDTPFNVCVPITDVDNTTFAVVNICAPDGGVVSGLTNPATNQYCLTYTPNLNFNGPDTLCIQVCDGSGGCDTSYVIITVTPVNDPPIANDDATTTTEDTPVTLTVTTNDTDVDGLIDPATVDLDPVAPGIQATFVVAGGTFTYLGAGNVTFTPNANFNGTATADYRVCDTGTPLPAMCDIATITIMVNAVNDSPIANDDATSTPEDTPVTLAITPNDTDVDGLIDPTTVDLDPNTAGIQTTFVVAGGTFTYLGAGNVTFTPNANFNGTASADYRVCDTGTPLPSMCDIATITITVNAVNDPPIANNDSATTAEDTPVPVPVLNNDTDVDGTLTPGSVAVVNSPDNGMASVNNMTGVITYTPDPNFVGNDTLTYAVCDSGTPVLCDTATVVFTVTATSVRLLGVMRLQGSLFNTPDTLTLMRDNLRSLGRLPKNEPYTALPAFVHYGGGGGEMVLDSATVFSNRGANSIVDWVFVELRNPAQSNQVVATRAALLQRDGDIVDMDGLSALTFENKLPANYFVSVRHRNHLGAMTANAMALTNSGTIVDFSSLSTPIWDDGTNLDGLEQMTINGKYALWAGNVNTNTTVVFAGQNNDKDPLFNQVDQAPGNFLHSQSFIYNGYHLGDVNMDGKAIFAGQTNDVDFIFNNVDSHPRNITRSQSFIIKQQLPQ